MPLRYVDDDDGQSVVVGGPILWNEIVHVGRFKGGLTSMGVRDIPPLPVDAVVGYRFRQNDLLAELSSQVKASKPRYD